VVSGGVVGSGKVGSGSVVSGSVVNGRARSGDHAVAVELLEVDEGSKAVVDEPPVDVEVATTEVVVEVLGGELVEVVPAAGLVVTTGGVNGVGPTASAGSVKTSPAWAFLSPPLVTTIPTATPTSTTPTIAGSQRLLPLLRTAGLSGTGAAGGSDGSCGGGKSLTVGLS